MATTTSSESPSAGGGGNSSGTAAAAAEPSQPATATVPAAVAPVAPPPAVVSSSPTSYLMYNPSSATASSQGLRPSYGSTGNSPMMSRKIPMNGVMVTSPAGSYVSGSVVADSGTAVHSERLIGSTVLREEFLNGMGPQQDQVRYVEVPVVQEVVRHVPRKEYVEVEKRVPRYEYEWVERVVEVPQIQVVERHVDVPQIQEVVRHVPVRQVVNIPKEVIKYVPRIETKIVEREVEVPGEIIEIPKPYVVETRVVVPKYVDHEVPTVVAQRLEPVVTESETEFVDVDMKEFNPYLVPVDIWVPRPVARQLIAKSRTEEHRVVDIPVAQFNALLKRINPGLSDQDLETRLLTVNGVAPIASGPGCNQIVPPLSNEWQVGRPDWRSPAAQS